MAYIDDPQSQKANMDYIRTSMNEPMLEKEHELALARRWREDGDEKALHEMIKSYTRLVVALASRFRNYGLPMGDLIQEGNVGLMQAASRFDPERDIRFSTYASWWIRSSIQDYVLRNWSIVRTGTTAAQKSLFFNMRRLRSKIESKAEREGLDDAGRKEIAKELNVRVQDVTEMEGRLSGVDQSLNATIGEDNENEWQNFLSDDRPNPEEIVLGTKDAKARSQWLGEALGELSDREQTIIRERHLRHETVTLEALGKELGVSKERVRQIEQRAMEKLKVSMMRYVDDKTEFFAGL
ncbi:MAG: RNA polymerase factor sigma-32 [Alphaproteobacteria bacterium]|nr:RNA polymerase factor sigma-32 [Alphaproteobacteria bacterium]